MSKSLTAKQENFCQAYIRLGDKSAAYREAYDAGKMKPETVNNNAYKLFGEPDIIDRISDLQEEVKRRNDITIDELVRTLALMVRFDIADLYKEDGGLKSLHEIPKEARLMIQQLDIDELFEPDGEGGRTMVGFTKKIKSYSKTDAIEKLMRHLGGYERDNNQLKPNTFITVNLGEGDPE